LQNFEEKHPHIRGRKIIDRIVLGGSDGVIESIAATAALNGVGLDFGTIFVAGFAVAIAGAVSMFFSSYLSERSGLDALRKDITRERMEIETEPEEERQELEELLQREGYGRSEIQVILNKLASDKEMWLRAQLRHELHLHTGDLSMSPLNKSIPAGLFFFVGAMIPLLSYIISPTHEIALIMSILTSLLVLFTLGATKFVSTKHMSVKNGLENAAIGGVAAILLYLIGRLITLI
jgi:VIT1/CCC1 family predicted Fe2+/Mn2+ transporter